MRSNNHRSSSSTTILSEENENLVLEPLLISNQDLQQSTNGLLKSEERRDKQSIYLTSISRLKNLPNLMSSSSIRSCCYATIRWIPVIFILAILGWSYYAYLVEMCIFTIDSVPKKVIYLCIYHVLLILFVWSYYRTMFEPIVGPPRDFYVGDIEGERIATAGTVEERRVALFRLARQSNLPLLTRHFDGSVRYCFVCQCIKPDRGHHCSVCEKCVLRYDHHCPWTNSCISYGNYKFFILFLGWALIFCLFVAGTSLEYFIQFWQSLTTAQKEGNHSTPASGKFQLLFLFFVSIMFAISVSSLFFYHLFLIGKNRTTVESFRAPMFINGPEREGFNLGCKQNFQDIFGTNFSKAIIPISTTRIDGVHYQVNNIILRSLQQQTGNTNGQNISPTNRSTDVILPLDTPVNNDRNYLLNNQTNNK